MRVFYSHEGQSVRTNGQRRPTERPTEPFAAPPGAHKGDIKKAQKAWRARLHRRERIQCIADAAVERWLRPYDIAVAQPPRQDGPVLRTLPRPPGVEIPRAHDSESVLPPPRREIDYRAGLFSSLLRLLRWLRGLSQFALAVLWDEVRRRNTSKNRARRLRETFQSMGTTFIKIGQQLSMRLDLLSPDYTNELATLLDNVPTNFPLAQVKEAIQRATGGKLEDAFLAFDPEPIGSASVACVYHAILKSGERVAVKVRRPGIGPLLAADMRALGWVLLVIEQLLFTPGFFENFIFELRTMLMEELDFAREARFADLYRRRVRKTRQMRFVTVPRIYFDLSNDEVLVSEYVSGVWLKDILPALESNDRQALAKLEEIRFDRIILARRIQLIARFNNFENIFFHADLHPANILVQPGNKLVLIDFGSCGSFNTRELNSWRRWFDAQSVDDVGGMVQAALGIMEPLPPIDRDRFGQELEMKFWSEMYAVKSKHAKWSERISSRLWYAFLELSRKFQVPMRMNTLRMIRASMLSDTIAVRLDNDQDAYREFRYYEKGAGRRAKKRVGKRLHRLLTPRKYIGIEHGIESALKLVYRIQQTIDSLASIRIGAIITRASYFLLLFLKHLVWIFATFAIFVGFGLYKNRAFDISTFKAVSVQVLFSWLWEIIALTPSALVFWRLSFRLKERMPWNR